MAKVFVSHASEDRERADQLYQWLVAEGHEVFLAQNLRDGIVVGDEWDKRLHERLRWADAVPIPGGERPTTTSGAERQMRPKLRPTAECRSS